ncbi:hypothetical protein MINS_16720 [Mycolicibacterium insubricum]|jgi:phosphotransferase system  glucose/maltose/N-acetylglucosamine-specific IIC component|uniref:hypothetical protein n=1 Tax=Mycolicibacterium insubricum TaxID=444597 RepID=UPI00138C0255|nr:hypothetical protein [Mycolicibacterium insubricum]MCB9440321.1 hypothetical protein [Mycolicibacterium sp.]MCV7081531.1 hypothetical protein [Mycolicibacterium insubricum]BBZ66243.1 hypothetical protein MINS_16720 [Mycolicibacterium insubricum]
MIYTDVNHRDVSDSGMLAAPFAAAQAGAALALWHAAPAAKRRAAASPGSPIRGFA